jgi:hypothetical protein
MTASFVNPGFRQSGSRGIKKGLNGERGRHVDIRGGEFL